MGPDPLYFILSDAGVTAASTLDELAGHWAESFANPSAEIHPQLTPAERAELGERVLLHLTRP